MRVFHAFHWYFSLSNRHTCTLLIVAISSERIFGIYSLPVFHRQRNHFSARAHRSLHTRCRWLSLLIVRFEELLHWNS